MSVAERCRTLQSRIDERNKLLRAHQDAEDIRRRVDDFAQLRLALQTRIQQREILAQYSVATVKVRDPEQIVQTLEDSARQLSEGYDATNRQLGQLKRSLGTLSSNLTAAITKAIQDLKGGIPASDEVFLRQVELIPTYSAKVVQIRGERDAILSGNDPLSSADALTHFLQHLDALKAVSDALNPDEFPADVLKFFKGARHGGARLDDLTPAVRDWLAEQNLLKHVRVTIAS